MVVERLLSRYHSGDPTLLLIFSIGRSGDELEKLLGKFWRKRDY